MRPTGQTIYYWRRSKKITQANLAWRAGVTRPNLSAIENGGRDLTVQTLRRIADALGVTPGTLVDGIGPKPSHTPVNLNRFSIDRVARLAVGQRLRATSKEKKLSLDLASVMKSKIPSKGVKQRRVRSARSENETLMRLKSELGPDLLQHLIHRVEKCLGGEAAHE